MELQLRIDVLHGVLIGISQNQTNKSLIKSDKQSTLIIHTGILSFCPCKFHLIWLSEPTSILRKLHFEQNDIANYKYAFCKKKKNLPSCTHRNTHNLENNIHTQGKYLPSRHKSQMNARNALCEINKYFIQYKKRAITGNGFYE